MQITNTFLSLIMVVTYAAANPVPDAVNDVSLAPRAHIIFDGDHVQLVDDAATDAPVKRQNINRADVTAWSGDACDGSSDRYTVINQGDRCIQVTNKRSITHDGR